METIRRACRGAAIVFRGDAYFARPLYEMCETDVSYVIGQITNRRLVRRAERYLRKVRRLTLGAPFRASRPVRQKKELKTSAFWR